MSIGRFDNTFVKLLKNQLKLGDDARVLTGTLDPSASATDGERGSIYLRDPGAGSGKLYIKNDDGSSTNWTELAASTIQGDLINHITNPDMEVDLSGWNTYQDAAGITPVDGTGGAPTVTVTQNLTTPLRGLADLKMTKDAADRQGEGFSFDYSADNADIPSQMELSFDYSTTANYVGNDVGVYIYDTVAATMTAIGSLNVSGAALNRKVIRFDCPANKSQRVIFHIQSVSALAYDLNIDNITLGPNDSIELDRGLGTGTVPAGLRVGTAIVPIIFEELVTINTIGTRIQVGMNPVDGATSASPVITNTGGVDSDLTLLCNITVDAVDKGQFIWAKFYDVPAGESRNCPHMPVLYTGDVNTALGTVEVSISTENVEAVATTLIAAFDWYLEEI